MAVGLHTWTSQRYMHNRSSLKKPLVLRLEIVIYPRFTFFELTSLWIHDPVKETEKTILINLTHNVVPKQVKQSHRVHPVPNSLATSSNFNLPVPSSFHCIHIRPFSWEKSKSPNPSLFAHFQGKFPFPNLHLFKTSPTSHLHFFIFHQETRRFCGSNCSKPSSTDFDRSLTFLACHSCSCSAKSRCNKNGCCKLPDRPFQFNVW